MTQKLYLADAYLKACRARVVAHPGPGKVVLDRTVLYAESGGQAADQGVLRWDGREARVVDAQFAPGGLETVVHTVEGDAPPVGAEVEVEVDWPRRYGLMRHHTAAHLFAAVLHRRYGALFTGGQLYPDRARFDIEIKEWRPELRQELEAAVNAEAAKDYPVRNETLPREAFLAEREALLRTKEDLVDPSLTQVRLTDIVGLDRQADGGTHVRSTREVGRILIDKVENKGKGHRRLHIHVE